MNLVITHHWLEEFSPGEMKALAAGSHRNGATGNNQHNNQQSINQITINQICQALNSQSNFLVFLRNEYTL